MEEIRVMKLFDKSYCARQRMLMDVLQRLRAQDYECDRVEDEGKIAVKRYDSSITYIISSVPSYDMYEGRRAYRKSSEAEIQEEAEYLASLLWSKNDDERILKF